MVGCLKTGRGNKQDPLLPGFRLLGFLETGKGIKQDPIFPVFVVGWVFLKLVRVINKTLFTMFEVVFGCLEPGRGNKQDPLLPGLSLCWFP